MAKDKITEYDATANNNTVCGDVNIAENSALPSDMNNFAREIMSHLKEGLGSGTPLYVDQTNNRLGINTSSPATALDVDGTATVNRLSTDGTIIDLQKDGTSVGSVGSVASGANLFISANSGVGMGIGDDNLYPVNASGASTDGSLDIGDASARFRNLYLSGGAYIGGTGSANYLDDYEEGTWTPTASTGLSYGFQNGRYIKIGTLVLASFDIDLDSVSASGNVLGGLPFTTANTNANFGIVNIGYYSSITTGVVWLSGYTRTNLTSLYFTGNSSSQTTIQHNTFNVFNDTTRILGNLIYHAN